MPSLTIREIPEEVLRKMRRAAKEQNRSLNSQALEWLEHCAKQWRRRMELQDLLESIRATRECVYQQYGRGTDSVDLVRVMRQRGKT
jgi:plasmid stability protein